MRYLAKLETLERDFEAIETKMASPSVQGDLKELQNLAKRHSGLEPVVNKYREYSRIAAEIGDAKNLAEGDDPEMAELAEEEISALEPLLEKLEKEIRVLLLPKDPNDEKSVVLEIRGGAGGEEAALFAADLFRMYTRSRSAIFTNLGGIASNSPNSSDLRTAAGILSPPCTRSLHEGEECPWSSSRLSNSRIAWRRPGARQETATSAGKNSIGAPLSVTMPH
jgi:hypothetical protein